MTIINEQLLLSELQVILAEKRTYYSFVRTGLAVATVPFTIIAFLLVTAQYHKIFEYFWIATIIIIILLLISGVGIYIVSISGKKISKLNDLIRSKERSNKRIDDILV